MSADERRLLPAERGTRWLFGKPYHWTIRDGQLSLGRCPVEDCATCEAQS